MGRIITLTTDFGNRDWFAGSVKGAIKTIAPRAEVIDITHDVPPGDIRAGAFVLEAAAPYFPRGTIHVAVIDPGVGTPRPALLVCTRGGGHYVGPDNGVLSAALSRERLVRVFRLTRKKFWRSVVSATFHGRDIFGPVAAHLSRGVPPERLGEPAKTWERLEEMTPVRARGEWQGRIVYIDRFGNAITNIVRRGFANESKEPPRIRVGRWGVDGVSSTYAEGGHGKLVAVWNSIDRLEMAVRDGSAAGLFGLKVGQAVIVRTVGSLGHRASKNLVHGR